MSQIGFYYNQTMCAGCKACQIACKDKNRLEIGATFREVRAYEKGSFPSVQSYYFSATCNHCTAPACIPACPTGAIEKKEDGTVVINKEACIGCKACNDACPFGVPRFIEADGVTGKCDGCINERAEGYNPICVDSCPFRALDFGEIEELKAKYSGTIDLVPAMIMNDSNPNTGPNILIQARSCALNEKGNDLLL